MERHFQSMRTMTIEKLIADAEAEKAKQANIDPLIAHVSELMNMQELKRPFIVFEN